METTFSTSRDLMVGLSTVHFLFRVWLFFVPLVVLADTETGLVAKYLFNGNAQDSTPNANHGTVKGATLTKDRFDQIGHAYSFNGIDQNIIVPHSPSLDIWGHHSLSFAAWVKVETVATGEQPIVWKWGPGGASYCQFIFGLAGNRVIFRLSETTTDLYSQATLSAGIWYHVVGVYDAATDQSRVYINGQLDNQRSLSYSIQRTQQPLFIGSGSEQSWPHLYGAIDNLLIHNRALSSADVLELYNLVILRHPQSQVGYWAKAVTFDVLIEGWTPFTYEWLKNDTNLPGATNVSLTLTNLQPSDAGLYRVVLRSGQITINSRPAALTVNPAGVSLNLYPGITIVGVVGNTYRIESSTNPMESIGWIHRVDVRLTNSVQVWLDSQPASESKLFYRVSAVIEGQP